MLRTIFGGVAVVGFLATASASHADAFRSAVEKVLVQDKRVANLDQAHRADMFACVEKVLERAPKPAKRAIAEASSFDEMQDRFGKLVMANRAKLEQAIASKCGHIVVNN
jgi:hypothetical protein